MHEPGFFSWAQQVAGRDRSEGHWESQGHYVPLRGLAPQTPTASSRRGRAQRAQKREGKSGVAVAEPSEGTHSTTEQTSAEPTESTDALQTPLKPVADGNSPMLELSSREAQDGGFLDEGK